jgi:hypothetical protein
MSADAFEPAADHARYFRAAPNDLRVVTNVVHNLHTIHDPKNHDRAPIPLIQLCGVKAPLTFKPNAPVLTFRQALAGTLA